MIRLWAPDDWAALRPLVGAALHDTYAAGAEFPPSQRNITTFLQLGMKWAAAGDPTLLLCVPRVVAFTLWGQLPPPLELDMRDHPCTAVMTYVVPSYRRQGLASQIREQAKAMALEKYPRILGAAYDERGCTSAERVGFEPCAIQLECRRPVVEAQTAAQ